MTTSPPSPEGPPPDPHELTEVFVTLTDSLVTDFDETGTLEYLVRACVDTLGWTAAVVLLHDQRSGLQVSAASEESVRALQTWQLQHEEGPSLECLASGAAAVAPDLPNQGDRWPEFAPMAQRLGFYDAYAVPLSLREHV